MPQLGLDVGGNLNIHIWACSLEIDEQVKKQYSNAYDKTQR